MATGKPGPVALPARPLLEWGRRRAGEVHPGSVLGDLLAGFTLQEISTRRGLPRHRVEAIRSYYHQLERGPSVCDGTACHFAGRDRLAQHLSNDGPAPMVRCLGHCYAAPAFRSGDRVFTPPPNRSLEAWLEDWGESGAPQEDLNAMPRRSLAAVPVVLRNLLPGGTGSGLHEYALPDGEEVLAAVEAARLRGRGGAAFPTAAKWRTARDTPAPERFVVANGDEGDPGSFVDRLLLEEDPHAILAGMAACARAIGSRRGFVYIRAEYPTAQRAMRRAIVEAREAGVLGAAFDVEVVVGAGSYLCGEETALLNSIEGLRGEPRPRPPFPAEAGLFRMPTVVQNVETLAIVPWVARMHRPTGTKAVSLSGAVRRPGVYEVALGTPIRSVLEQGGGGAPEGRRWRMALVGGPMGRLLPEAQFDTPLDFDGLPAMGHAGIVVLDDTVTPRTLAEHLFAFAREESCGNCAPCRIGTARLADMRTRADLERLLTTLEMGSLCGFGQGVPRPVRDLLREFGDEVLP